MSVCLCVVFLTSTESNVETLNSLTDKIKNNEELKKAWIIYVRVREGIFNIDEIEEAMGVVSLINHSTITDIFNTIKSMIEMTSNLTFDWDPQIRTPNHNNDSSDDDSSDNSIRNPVVKGEAIFAEFKRTQLDWHFDPITLSMLNHQKNILQIQQQQPSKILKIIQECQEIATAGEKKILKNALNSLNEEVTFNNLQLYFEKTYGIFPKFSNVLELKSIVWQIYSKKLYENTYVLLLFVIM